MKIAIVAITGKGKIIALKLKKALPESVVYLSKKIGKSKNALTFKTNLTELSEKLFTSPRPSFANIKSTKEERGKFEGIIFCMALGIVVRIIAPFLKDKYSDPAVVVIDDQGRFSISTLSGHEGGANRLAVLAANILGAQEVITTASEAAKNMVIGIGCRRGVDKDEILKAVNYALKMADCSLDKIRLISTIDIKENEAGLKKACLELGIPLRIISSDLIKSYKGTYQKSALVKKKIGVEGVSEPCALLAGKKPKLILPKTKVGRVTVALVQDT